MGAIAFSKSPEGCWSAAGWALRQILDDVAYQHPHDREFAAEFESAKAIDGFMIYLLPPALAVRVTMAIREVARGIIKGTVRSGIEAQTYSNENTLSQYHEALHELLKAIAASLGSNTSAGGPPFHQ